MNQLVRTIDILRIQRACASRKEECDHCCAECDLHLERDEVLKAFNTAIAFLDAQRNIDELMKGGL